MPFPSDFRKFKKQIAFFRVTTISDAQDIPVVRGKGNGRRGRGDRYVRRPRGRTVSRPRGGDRKEEIVVGHEEVAGQGK